MNSLALDDLRWFVGCAASFRVADIGGTVAGFLICLPPEASYDSPNFRWLKARYRDFLYIDRVAVPPSFRRRGIAGSLYCDASRIAPSRYSTLACEVNLRPRNDESLAFHERFGFEPVGTCDHGYVEVQYMVTALPLPDDGRTAPG